MHLLLSCRLAALSLKALAEGPSCEPDAPDGLNVVALAATVLCHSAADPFQAVDSRLRGDSQQHEAKLAQAKSTAMRELPKTQQSSAALLVIAAW